VGHLAITSILRLTNGEIEDSLKRAECTYSSAASNAVRSNDDMLEQIAFVITYPAFDNFDSTQQGLTVRLHVSL
jgi:hypothetical protein